MLGPGTITYFFLNRHQKTHITLQLYSTNIFIINLSTREPPKHIWPGNPKPKGGCLIYYTCLTCETSRNYKINEEI